MTDQQWDIMCSISPYGGIQTPYLLAMLYSPPNLRLALNMHVKNMALVKEWLNQYEPAYLDAKVTYLKFLKHLNRLYDSDRIRKASDLHMWEWWQGIECTHQPIAEAINQDRWRLQTLETQPINTDDLAPAYAASKWLKPHIEHAITLLQEQINQVAEIENLAGQGYEMEKELKQAQRQLANLAANQWLCATVVLDIKPPDGEIFASRPQYPTQMVNTHLRSNLNDLVERGLIDIHRPRGNAGVAGSYIYLSTTGRSQVAEYLGFGRKLSKVYFRPVGSYVSRDLPHRIAQSEARVAITLAAQRMGWSIAPGDWLDTHDLEVLLPQVKVQIPKTVIDAAGKPQPSHDTKILKIPDDFVYIDTGRGWKLPLVVELDNATATVNASVGAVRADDDIKTKYLTWGAFCKDKQLQKYFPDAKYGVWHLTVTTGRPDRAQYLQATAMSTVKNKAARSRYWFACLADFSPNWRDFWRTSVFNEPIYLHGDSAKYQVMDVLGAEPLFIS